MRHYNSHESSGPASQQFTARGLSHTHPRVVNTLHATWLQPQSVDHNRSGIINQVIS